MNIKSSYLLFVNIKVQKSSLVYSLEANCFKNQVKELIKKLNFLFKSTESISEFHGKQIFFATWIETASSNGGRLSQNILLSPALAYIHKGTCTVVLADENIHINVHVLLRRPYTETCYSCSENQNSYSNENSILKIYQYHYSTSFNK